ncbi:hypothetical protein HMPREF1544_01273 [Mucor circinelloides 1006PhL]|uniref:GATA-type domain-containing protein n=1 Tax=Mucor circinelloides f. circinelloides (strain 1006PhL) TaxID=1220926 RepID=S2JPV3_MUCC1|nr:hypothetical protein HMPREF1544_01273 [Mucor circinelloides 1006PhL]
MDYGVKAGDMLKSKSLLDFIHPDELSLATTDLLNFIRIKTLAGAVTRCRLRSIKSLIHQEHQTDKAKVDNLQNWIITDVVMYTATNSSILTFFHSLQLEIDNTAANCNSLSRHANQLDSPIPTDPTAATLTPTITTNNPIPSTTTNANCCGTGQLNIDESNKITSILQQHSLLMDEPLRLFQIYDTQCQQLLISWPNTTVTESLMDLTSSITLKEMDRRLQYPQLRSDAAACTHHSHSKSNMMLESNKLCQIERIIITYGNLTFTCFQITALNAEGRPYYNSDHSSSSTSSTSNENSIPNHTLATSEPSDNTRFPLPRAWRGRFGVFEKKCENCQTNTSPEWRKGPGGHKTYARLVAKHEKRQLNLQQPKDEEQTMLLGVNASTTTKFKSYKSKK